MRGFFAALQNDRQKDRQGQEKNQIPPLRCGMTTKLAGNGKAKGWGFAEAEDEEVCWDGCELVRPMGSGKQIEMG
jgi:hypothetical protein